MSITLVPTVQGRGWRLGHETMKSQNILVLTIILAVVIVATLSNVSAARLLSEDFNGTKDDFSKYNYVYETAKYNLTYWIQRLSSGSSGGGDGH
ncbi:hypothetical protein Ancab_008398 [Ancistrocladus abbreviatus]